MKLLLKLILVLIFVVGCMPSVCAQTRQLVIVHTNDTHSQIQPLSPFLYLLEKETITGEEFMKIFNS